MGLLSCLQKLHFNSNSTLVESLSLFLERKGLHQGKNLNEDDNLGTKIVTNSLEGYTHVNGM